MPAREGVSPPPRWYSGGPFGAEREVYDDTIDKTEYLNTVSAVIGPNPESVWFNIILLDDGEEYNLLSEPYYSVVEGQVEDSSYAFISEKTYEEVCVRFRDLFPPNPIPDTTGNIIQRKEYCRPITESAISSRGEPALTPVGQKIQTDSIEPDPSLNTEI